MVFRWFKCKLKPPNMIGYDKLWLAIWDTSFWNFLVKFGHNGPILGHILGPILVISDICHFLTIPGPFEYFQKMGALRKSKFFDEGAVV